MSLSVNGLSKRYGNVWAVRDLSFEVEDGSIIGILGSSGSGKTTLLKTIAGLVKPTSGTIRLDDKDVTKSKAKERGVTYLGGRDEAIIKQLRSRFAGGESGGEHEFSRFEDTIKNTGNVLLLDEPFSQMDTVLREEGFAAIRKASKFRNRVIIFATSDFDQIARIADEVAFLNEGEIVQTGSSQQIYDEPLTVDVARLTGDCNLIVGRRLTSTDAQLPEFHTIDGGHRIFAQSIEKNRLGPINQNMTLAIRPEQLLMSAGASYPEDNLLKGVVTAIKHRGATSIIEFDAKGLTLTTLVFKMAGLDIGDEFMLGLPPHKISILKQ